MTSSGSSTCPCTSTGTSTGTSSRSCSSSDTGTGFASSSISGAATSGIRCRHSPTYTRGSGDSTNIQHDSSSVVIHAKRGKGSIALSLFI